MQESLFGVDIIPERDVSEIVAPKVVKGEGKGFSSFGRRRFADEFNTLEPLAEVVEAPPAWSIEAPGNGVGAPRS